MKKIFFAAIVISCFISNKNLFAQEEIAPLRYNTALFNHVTPSATRDAVPLPFVDDFSYPGPDPDPNLWQNVGAFVNTTFPIDPVTYGVASFDGLNGQGIPYDPTSFSFNIIGGADSLNSMPILLGSSVAADSIYFSFFYQPGGLGDVPNSKGYNLANFNVAFGDSLVLEFKDSSGTWRHIWGHDGEDFQPFKQVLIPITNPIFFHDDFQFRFRNYATLVGNYDQWHIDYVRLDSSRNKNDTVINDVAIQYYPTSILKNYEVMPWNQFVDYQKTEKADHHTLTIWNNFDVSKNTSHQFESYKKTTGPTIFTSGVQSNNIAPKISAPFDLDSFPIPAFTDDTLTITTKYSISATGDINTRDDTIYRDQVFSNYLAYDDGSAEATYRLLGSPASLALEFHVNKPDTLQAIAIHFANTDEDISQNVFSLLVWSALNDQDTLLRDDFLTPEYATSYNGFTLYRLSHPILVTDSFFIGWQQTSIANDLKMDVGFDFNDDSHTHMHYNIFGTWYSSQYPGAVMMRAYLGGTIPFGVGVEEVKPDNADITLYPNPVNDVLNIKSKTGDLFMLEVIDNTGRVLLTEDSARSISVAQLPSGFYFLRTIETKTGKSTIHKFIKEK